MKDTQVISGIQLGFNKFDSSENKFKNILSAMKEARFFECLNFDTKVYSEFVNELYLHVVVNNGVIATEMKGINLKIGKAEINKY